MTNAARHRSKDLAISQVVTAIKTAEIRSQVISVYDAAQTAVCKTSRYRNLVRDGRDGEGAALAHDVAIRCVRAFLIGYGAVPMMGCDLGIVDLAYTEIT